MRPVFIAQNNLSSVTLAAFQTLVYRQKSAEKRTQSEGSLANRSAEEHRRSQSACAERHIDSQQTEGVLCPPEL